jgi:hypothetical protein
MQSGIIVLVREAVAADMICIAKIDTEENL